MYKVKTYNEITKLEQMTCLYSESVPGTAGQSTSGLRMKAGDSLWKAKQDAQITGAKWRNDTGLW